MAKRKKAKVVFPTRPWNDADKQKAYDMRMASKTVTEIAAELKRSYKSVHCFLSRCYGTEIFREIGEKDVDRKVPHE